MNFEHRFSTKELSDAVTHVLRRFPLVVLAALIGTYLGVCLIENNFNDRGEQFIPGLMVCLMALPFLMSLKLIAVDALFNVKVRGERFGELWVLIVGLFHPMFFMARNSSTMTGINTTKYQR